MQILKTYRDVPNALRGAAIAIGNFDGVHRGHQSVLRRTCEIAAERPAPAGVMVFDPHPREYFQRDMRLFTLTPLPEKLALFDALGLDLAVVLTFDAALAGLSAEEFVRKILVAGLGVAHVVIGYNFFFGKGRSGDPDTMRRFGREQNFGVEVIAPAGDDADPFSSSRVRALLRKGDVRAAAEQLGHWWRLTGTVVEGAGRGHGLGFPTANLSLAHGQELAHGIYAVRVRLGDARFDGAAYLGTRPTFDNGPATLEVFFFDFDADLYGKDVSLEFIARIRDDQAFDTSADLERQMSEDCDQARRVLAELAVDDPMTAYPIGERLAK